MHELYTALAEYYDAIYRGRAERVKEEIDFVEEIFREDAGRRVSRVLDLACGTGIPTLELAERGYDVVGLDLHGEMLRIARRKAEGRGLSVEFLQGDALSINFEDEFDAVTMFFSSITYFDESAIKQLFNSVKRALRPGGVFIADFPAWHYSGRANPTVWDERKGEEGIVITDWRELEPAFQKLRFKRLVQIIRPDGSVRAFMVDDELNVYTPREMRLMAGSCFDDVRVYGNLKRDMGPRESRYWLVALKRA
ncbi:class I SAM-dependent methyltransferase [Palaeococcus ferrophilus]|uniref:class I SAM-dependent methyltransferase n=1 Tax=Palaeococcus ferrophilus TaxID=83868 RepID=UPI00064EEF9E|nr:class I SAM-dependent methyltransferase [Palaeococcus ferrophilus]